MHITDIIGIYLKVIHHKIIVNPPVIFGAVCMTGVTSFYCIANKLTTAANTIVLQFTAPIFAIFFMWIFFKERPKKMDPEVYAKKLGAILAPIQDLDCVYFTLNNGMKLLGSDLVFTHKETLEDDVITPITYIRSMCAVLDTIE